MAFQSVVVVELKQVVLVGTRYVTFVPSVTLNPAAGDVVPSLTGGILHNVLHAVGESAAELSVPWPFGHIVHDLDPALVEYEPAGHLLHLLLLLKYPLGQFTQTSPTTPHPVSHDFHAV